MNERAIIYRKQNKISDDLGTAVNVQVMVFGNKGETSATGVAFTRNPADGTKEFYGDFLVNAQGEDVVAGIRNTEPIADLKTVPGLEEAGKQLDEIFVELEEHYHDMMDIEFTIEQGKLWMLQTRVGKRTAMAALAIAMQFEAEGAISREEAVMRVAPDQLDQLLHPQFDPKADFKVLTKGMNASPGAAVGKVVFSAEEAVHCANKDQPCILVRWETTPDDLKGMVAAEGILTSHGGKTSHAAVIARGMGAPCVCGAEALKIDAKAKEVTVSGTDVALHEGDIISINGTTGDVILGAVPLVRPELTGDLETILGGPTIRRDASRGRIFGVRANADNRGRPAVPRLRRRGHRPRPHRAHVPGRPQGDHPVLHPGRPHRRQAAGPRPAAEGPDRRLRPCSRPWTARPSSSACSIAPARVPGHPARLRAVELAHAEDRGESDIQLKARRDLLARLDSFQEANPMLGLRGCRLGIVYPELTEMQVRAIASATAHLKKRGFDPKPEIMVPLIGTVEELKVVREQIEGVIAGVSEQTGVELHTSPWAARSRFRAPPSLLTRSANTPTSSPSAPIDLTQMGFGYSRDDVESAFIPLYLNKKILKANPFETLDPGIAKLVKLGVEGGHQANEKIVCGVCGETGGDPDSIQMYYDLGLDYVSCSPYRVPIARLAAAQAKIKSNGGAQKLAWP